MTSRRPHSFASKMPFNRGPLNLGKIAIFLLITVTFAGAQSETAIYRFRGLGDGGMPMDGLAADNSGSVYGAASAGGTSCPQEGRSGCGVIFKLRPPGTVGGSWTTSVLYKFTGLNDGAIPAGGLLVNPSTGKIYGAASLGGANDYGTIFELDPGAPWTQTVLHTFSRTDGENPTVFFN